MPRRVTASGVTLTDRHRAQTRADTSIGTLAVSLEAAPETKLAGRFICQEGRPSRRQPSPRDLEICDGAERIREVAFFHHVT